jgi:3-isopropylmalate/(R)-2-methylmalate dehydratase large subunit
MSQRTLFDKIWDAHAILERDDGETLLWVDRHYVHEGSHHAFTKLREKGLEVAEPDLTFGVADHYVPTANSLRADANCKVNALIPTLSRNTRDFGVRLFGMNDPQQGIVHVVGPEQGLSLPGMIVVCGDSHTSTHGALGAIGFGIGASDVAHVLANQTIWQKKPKRMKITFQGKATAGVGAKDMALHWIAKYGADGGREHAIEYAGDAVSALSIEARLTLCNLSIEGGAKCGLVAPDHKTFEWLHDRPFAPKDFDRAITQWSNLNSDRDASFDREVSVEMSQIAPVVTWGTSPEDALPIVERVPNPLNISDPNRARRVQETLEYMGLTAGQLLTDIIVDQAFIGSCTNARIEDLRIAAAILSGRKAIIPGIVSPGSRQVKIRAEQEGLDQVFQDAGLEWRDSGCSMCVAMNGDLVAPGHRCASTTNRNFRGRQGKGARTHLMSPAMAAAAAITGKLTDVRPLLKGRTA